MFNDFASYKGIEHQIWYDIWYHTTNFVQGQNSEHDVLTLYMDLYAKTVFENLRQLNESL